MPPHSPDAERGPRKGPDQNSHLASGTQNCSEPLGPVGRALLDAIEEDTVDIADIPPETLAAPTLGALRRRQDVDDWCEEARIACAVELALEARRRTLIERLDSVMEFLAVGATPDQAMTRIRRLVAEYDDRPWARLEVAA
jgi:hypothetical protein